MLKKLKSNSGAAFVLAFIFWTLMIFLTDIAIETGTSDAETVSTFQRNEYNYFLTKAALNYYGDFFNGLRYTETTTSNFPYELGDTVSYTEGIFEFISTDPTAAPGTLNVSKLATFESYIDLPKYQTSFAYFQLLRSRVRDGSVILSTHDEAYLAPHQAFSANFTITDLDHKYGDVENLVISTDLTFFGELVAFDNFISGAENTARIKVQLIDIGDPIDLTDDNVIYTQSISCIPTLDETSGVKVWTWGEFN